MASGVTTSIKTDVCSFSEYRVYPGRGKKVIAKDGKVYFYIAKKQASLAAQRISPQKILWTQMWRRNNKKIQAITGSRRKSHKRVKTVKAIEGLSLDEIKRKQGETAHDRKTVRDAALQDAREIAKRKREQNAKKTSAAIASGKTQTKQSAKGQSKSTSARAQKSFGRKM